MILFLEYFMINRQKILPVLGIITAFVFLTSCEYQTNEIYFRNINKDVEIPDLQINLNLNTDTIYFYNYSTVKLNLKLTNKALYSVIFYLNNVRVENVDHTDPQNYTFTLDVKGRSVMRIRAEIYTSTETGSIADELGMESFKFTTGEWVLINETEKPEFKAEIEDGRLKLSWTPTRNTSPGKYIITDYNFTDSTSNTWFIDSSYYGGSKQYCLRADDNGASGYEYYIEIIYPYPRINVTNRDSFLVSWDKSKFYNNIKGYRITIDGHVFYFGSEDTSFVYNDGVLGTTSWGIFELILKSGSEDDPGFYTIGNLQGDFQLSFLRTYSFFSGSFFPLTGEVFYYWSNVDNRKTIFKFSTERKSIIDSAAIWFEKFSVSPNNKYIFCIGSDDAILIQPAGLVQLKQISKSDLYGSTVYFSLNITDIGTTVFFDYLKSALVIYDLLNNKILTEIPVHVFVEEYKISANGKYIFEPALNTLFMIENNSYKVIRNGENNSHQFKFFEFFPDNEEQIALYDGSTFYIKNCSDFTTIRSFALNGAGIINIDFENRWILAYADYNYFIFSIETGDLLKTVPAFSDINSRIFNDYIFSNNCQFSLKSVK
jgi:hypothetical protein